MTPRDVMQQALDALVDLWNDHLDEFDDQTDRAIQALRSELAKPAAVPDALTYSQGTRDYVDGWNDCREAMLSAAPQPPAPAVSPVDVEAVREVINDLNAINRALARAIGEKPND